MAAYRSRDLLLLPNLLSALRLPLAAAFPFAARRERARFGLAVVALAGLTDVLDGFFARRLGQATAIGAVVDGVADKAFAAMVLGTLVERRKLSPRTALLLATRELVELPLALLLYRRRKSEGEDPDHKANVLGKLATAFELGSVVAILLGVRKRAPLLGTTAALGVLAGASYWRRELRALRQREDDFLRTTRS